MIFAKSGIYTNGHWRFFNVEKWDRAAGQHIAIAEHQQYS